MTVRPGVNVVKGAIQVARGEETSTGTWFVTGFAERGPIGTPKLVTTLQDFVTTYGDRVSYSQLYDALDLFFNEGGAEAYVSRVGSGTPTVATRTLLDRAGTPIATVRVDAKYPGTYGSRVTVAIANGTVANTFDLTVFFDAVLVETFAGNTSPADAVDKTSGSGYVTLVNLASASAAPTNNPAVIAASALTGGNDNHGAAVEADWTTALTAFPITLGPGQVSAPGRTTTAAQQALVDHAAATNRTAYLDVADFASNSALLSAAASLASYTGSKFAGLFGSWVTIPPLTGAVTPRAVPGSALAAALTARTDATFESAGHAPAGQVAVPSSYVTSIDVPTPTFTDAQYTALNDAGVNMTKNIRGRGIRLYGFRSVTSDAVWEQLQWARELMYLTAQFDVLGEDYLFRQIDGRGQLFGEFAGDLSAVCATEFEAASLYGDVAEDAYQVDVSSAVNTPTTISNGEVHAVVYVKVTPYAELISIEVDKAPLSTTFADQSTGG